MTKKLIIAILLIFLLLIGRAAIRKVVRSTRLRAILARREANVLEREREPRNGDIIFQTSLSGQSKAIQEGTGSEYSHCEYTAPRKAIRFLKPCSP